jgi:peptidyl-prolyl cis-trans isomerase B (cyclophilin B)
MAGGFLLGSGDRGSARHGVTAACALLLAGAMVLLLGGCSENVKKPAAVITMEKGGEFRIDFYAEDAPKTVENFVTLAKKGFYDGLTFHRVHPNVLVHGGDPRGDGTGGPGYAIKAEFNKQKHVRGAVVMARLLSPDSAGSQFYIMLADVSELDGQYTVFGKVTSGMDVVDKISIGDKMKTVKIVEAAL